MAGLGAQKKRQWELQGGSELTRQGMPSFLWC
jgi:hypothetical protein